jgi:phospholipase A1
MAAWYRLPESAKKTPESVKGDDNPDIERCLGYGDLVVGWRGSHYEWMSTLQGNPSTGKGGIEIDLSFPLFNCFRGLLQYFNGYGDALIDYNHFQQRLIVGILLTELY